MSGYTGNPDAEAEQANILAENGIDFVRKEMAGPVYEQCEDCGNNIDPKRVAYMLSQKIRCTRCIGCQTIFDKMPKRRIRMLDRIL